MGGEWNGSKLFGPQASASTWSSHQLTLATPAEKAKGVNDEMSERSLGAFRNSYQVTLHSNNVIYTELP